MIGIQNVFAKLSAKFLGKHTDHSCKTVIDGTLAIQGVVSVLAPAWSDALLQLKITLQESLLPDPSSVFVWTECAKICSPLTVRLGRTRILQVIKDSQRATLEDGCVPRLFYNPASLLIMKMADVRSNEMQKFLILLSACNCLTASGPVFASRLKASYPGKKQSINFLKQDLVGRKAYVPAVPEINWE